MEEERSLDIFFLIGNYSFLSVAWAASFLDYHYVTKEYYYYCSTGLRIMALTTRAKREMERTTRFPEYIMAVGFHLTIKNLRQGGEAWKSRYNTEIRSTILMTSFEGGEGKWEVVNE